MSNDPLDSNRIINNIPFLLPDDQRQIHSSQDALVCLLHTAMIALRFRLVGLDDSSPAQESENGVLIEGWNEYGPNSYELRYKHKQSSLVFFIKVVRLSSKMLIYGIAMEGSGEKTNTLEISLADYLKPSFFPFDATADSANLKDGFTSQEKAQELLKNFKVSIIQNLIPKLQVEGYEEEGGRTTSSTTNQPSASRPNAQRQPPPDPPFVLPPTGIPNTRDPLRVPNVGRSDLDPLGGYNPFAPPPLFGGGDGMYVGPGHGIFRDRFGQQGGVGGNRGPWGGDGYLPPLGAPPGARFDPIMPGGIPGPFGPDSRGRSLNRRGPFGGPGGGGGAAGPDNDEFPPPGFNDMYS